MKSLHSTAVVFICAALSSCDSKQAPASTSAPAPSASATAAATPTPAPPQSVATTKSPQGPQLQPPAVPPSVQANTAPSPTPPAPTTAGAPAAGAMPPGLTPPVPIGGPSQASATIKEIQDKIPLYGNFPLAASIHSAEKNMAKIKEAKGAELDNAKMTVGRSLARLKSQLSTSTVEPEKKAAAEAKLKSISEEFIAAGGVIPEKAHDIRLPQPILRPPPTSVPAATPAQPAATPASVPTPAAPAK